jgi:hypothetical protein
MVNARWPWIQSGLIRVGNCPLGPRYSSNSQRRTFTASLMTGQYMKSKTEVCVSEMHYSFRGGKRPKGKGLGWVKALN